MSSRHCFSSLLFLPWCGFSVLCAANPVERQERRGWHLELLGDTNILHPLEAQDARPYLDAMPGERAGPAQSVIKPRPVKADEGSGAAPGLDEPGMLQAL
jgi:hypothetical protein